MGFFGFNKSDIVPHFISSNMTSKINIVLFYETKQDKTHFLFESLIPIDKNYPIYLRLKDELKSGRIPVKILFTKNFKRYGEHVVVKI